MGKTYMVERVLSLEYDVVSDRADGFYNVAAKAVGIGGEGVPKTWAALRDGSQPAEVVEGFYAAHDEVVGKLLANATRYRVTPVIEGYTLMFEPEVQSVRRMAVEHYGEDVRVVRAFVHASYGTWLANMVRRATERGRTALPIATMAESRWRQRVEPPEPVEGIEDRTIATVDDLHALVEELGVGRHHWYQGFQVGPVQVKAMTDAHEKVATIATEDIAGKTVIDLCCATAVTAMLMRAEGATLVTAVESNPARVAKAHETVKTLRRHAGFPRAGVKILMGDAFKLIKRLNADTVVLLGALHYFEDHAGTLKAISPAAGSALYVEVLLTDQGKGKAFTDPEAPFNMTTSNRKNGAQVYAPDTPTFARIIAEALPDFELVSRVPSQGLGKGADTYREVWGFKRIAPVPAA